MIKTSKKLYTSVILMIISISLMVSVSFAWLTLSNAPIVDNIKIVIGGDNTIKIAQNIETEVNDEIINYPGNFEKVSSLDISDNSLLSPVSTADGVNWFVLKDEMKTSQKNISSLEDFELDTELKYANTKDGGYIYVDFWIVSSIDNYILRVTSGDEDEVGSYALQLPSSVKNFTNETGYNLDDSYQSLASSIRVGFLVNEDQVDGNSDMNSYVNSKYYDDQYTSLRGVYGNDSDYNFLIYEPNGLSHSNEGQSVVLSDNGLEYVSCNDGEYHITKPIGLDFNGDVDLVDIADRLIIQTSNKWKYKNDILVLDDIYQGFLKSNASDKSIDAFYNDYLKGIYMPYANSGLFLEDTWNLYSLDNYNRVKSQEVLETLRMNNAVISSQIVRLKKNTPQRIRMFVWIEGQDIDCSYYAADKTLALRLELAGSSGT